MQVLRQAVESISVFMFGRAPGDINGSANPIVMQMADVCCKNVYLCLFSF